MEIKVRVYCYVINNYKTMDNITMEINGIPLTITEQAGVIENIRNDNDYAKLYVEEMFKNNLLKDYGIDKLRTIDILETEPYDSMLTMEGYDITNDFGDSHNILSEDQTEQSSASSYDFNNEVEDLIWRTKGKPSPKDLEAVEYFLTLRGSDKYKQLFDDKKHSLNYCYKQLAIEMWSLNLGNMKMATEKLRQKFKNLTKRYIHFINHVKYSTGTGHKSPPPFYDLLHIILGEKDKIGPRLIIDSVEPSTDDNNERNICEEIEADTNKNCTILKCLEPVEIKVLKQINQKERTRKFLRGSP